jgi:hypothetical protein
MDPTEKRLLVIVLALLAAIAGVFAVLTAWTDA